MKKKYCGRYHFTHAYQKSQSYDLRFLRYGVRQTGFSVIFGHFLHFYPLMIPKIKTLKNWKKCLQILSFTYGVQYMKIHGSRNIRRNRQIFLLLWAIFVLSTPWRPWKSKFWKIKKNTWRYITCAPWMKIVWCWFRRYGAWQTEFFVILDHFLPFYTPMDPENENFESMKITHGRIIIILHMCNINDNHMIYGSWDMERDGHNFCHFGTFFALLLS